MLVGSPFREGRTGALRGGIVGVCDGERRVTGVDPGVTAREGTSGVRARYDPEVDPGVEARERTSGVRARYDPGVEARERMGVRFPALKHLDRNDLRFWGFMPFTFPRVVLLSKHAYLASFLRYPFCDMNVTQYGWLFVLVRLPPEV